MATATSLVAAIFVRGPNMRPLAVVAVTLLGAVYVGLPVAAVPLLHALPARSGWVAPGGSPWAGLAVLALPLAATWVGDACAYFAGSAWGDRKLAPSISPNKSWVGFWAGLAGAAAAAALWHVAARPVLMGFPLGLVGTVALGAALGLGAIVGDLVESLLKREANVKDSGTFFPGHGGALDRLDALLVTLPLAYMTLALAEALP
jgi:phosphatidate cytidylyltransferase